MASFDPEQAVGARADFIVCGVDEVGRGPLAGPVVAAAVHIPLTLWNREQVARLRDSKRVPIKEREELAAWIKAHCRWGLAEIGPGEIDQINILQASLKAMAHAVSQISADFALIDGNRAPALPIPSQTVVKGDHKSRSIAAASILAKVHRDHIMADLDAQFPLYGWAQNAGYPTAAHRAALALYGPSCHHRATFRGVKNVTSAT